MIPNSAYYKRGTFELKKVCEMATSRAFTDVIIFNENKKKPNGLLLIHLPDGPTAHFKAAPPPANCNPNCDSSLSAIASSTASS